MGEGIVEFRSNQAKYILSMRLFQRMAWFTLVFAALHVGSMLSVPHFEY
jgi:hypothetical protein